MYTIDEYRTSSPTYDIPHGAARECGRENIIRALEIEDQATRSRRMQAMKQFFCRLGQRLFVQSTDMSSRACPRS